MRLAERLGGAVVAGLLMASLMGQVEAAAASHGPDAGQKAARARLAVIEDIAAIGLPEQELARSLAQYSQDVARSEQRESLFASAGTEPIPGR